jgi:hypothetical protein
VAKKIMFILRGMPGSGKSGFAFKLFQQFTGDTSETQRVAWCSADHFFHKKVDGPVDIFNDIFSFAGANVPTVEYDFNPAFLGQAHSKCFCDAFKACRNSKPIVIIDNTNSQLWEYQNYELVAEQFGYEVGIYEIGIASTNYTGDHNNIYSVVDKQRLEAWFARQQHGVPLDVYLQMWWRWEIDQRAYVLTPHDTDPKQPLNTGLKVENFEEG